jgi:hypothetical protein
MCRSFLQLLGFASLLVAVAVGLVVAGLDPAQAHPGHGHGRAERVHAPLALAISPDQIRTIAGASACGKVPDTASVVQDGSRAATGGPGSSGPAAIGGSAAQGDRAPSGGGCAVPGCCSGGPCSICCSVVPAAAGFVWPSRAAAALGALPGPTLDDAVSFGLKRPPRSFA